MFMLNTNLISLLKKLKVNVCFAKMLKINIGGNSQNNFLKFMSVEFFQTTKQSHFLHFLCITNWLKNKMNDKETEKKNLRKGWLITFLPIDKLNFLKNYENIFLRNDEGSTNAVGRWSLVTKNF